MTRHLGDQVAAFVDGQLGYAARERALQHLSGCADCRAAVEQQRWVKTRVQRMPGAEPSANLLSSLTRVTASAAPPARLLAADTETGVAPETGDVWLAPRSRVRRGGLLAAGVGSVAAGVVSLAYVVGGVTAAEPPSVSPPVGQFSAEFAGSEQPLPLADPAMEAFPVIDTRAPAGSR